MPPISIWTRPPHDVVLDMPASITTGTMRAGVMWFTEHENENSFRQLSRAFVPFTLSQYLRVMNTTTLVELLIPSTICWTMSPVISFSSIQTLSSCCSRSKRAISTTRAWLLRPASSVPQSCVKNASYRFG
eukprot:c14774_g1_i1.p1 GENE.c14774_g1_i1~~c14774_g1_i1.p1  ORF type:complete len:131 (+),score=25.56 c14774_g1_i1:235-627(+)